MPYREKYFDGTEIQLKFNGCDGCELLFINGIMCHETGCPFEHHDYTPMTEEDEEGNDD